ncbi:MULTISPECIES: hypothetical protein [Metabacillus]|uniref:Uncharacterized protein n=1 Tax=Metabacillus hrfriensis TaxID=3048891 RepID=A0ACD4RDP7_9BACI|nr:MULTISPECIES: hypothetical protein [Metabacillus]UAL53078.1 hypothetical protein K8L98_04545 [Metabacillus dongyingensis]UOK58645.1 hypothetical protein MGI18_05690 [Bacillus sp. OVS6]USK29402.1 hypothetical protein LIT32_04570 [Bacillus sp. CMF21]WHZ58626.1 hypothetical protein QLQ22_04570 [Metabacillus sp. CT-WN-B3]
MQDLVIYKNEIYTLFHKYESGYCEILKTRGYLRVILVHESELHYKDKS